MTARLGVEAFVERLRELPAGYYRELPPAADLREVVACGWIKVVRQARADTLVPILPDGCADVMTYDDGAPFVVGPDATTRWATLGDGLVITGLRLRPGATRTVLGCPASELLGARAEVTDVLGAGGRALDLALRPLHEPAARLAALEDWVRRRLAEVTAPDRALVAACRLVARDPRLGMDALAARVGWNARMLHRQFVAGCGYGPKHFQRVMRVQGVLRAAQAPGNKPSLAAIAADLGFADQPHMTRDFRSITGLSPTAYLADADPALGRWLDADWPL